MRRSVLGAVGAVAAALTSFAVAAPAGASHSWGGYHWARTSNPFTLQLGDNVDSRWDASLALASSDWSASSVLDTVIVAGQANPKNCRAVAGRVEVCNSKYGSTGWLGIASINITGGTHITAGTVKLNDTYFDTARYNTPAWRNMVTCQEVGHTFGLGHQDEGFDNANLDTCMDYTNDPTSNQHPNQHDYDQLESIYSHTDNTTTVSSTTAASGQTVGNSPRSWGERVEGSREHGESTYVRDLGNGSKVVTFVIWAS
jgi:hypothetical protein